MLIILSICCAFTAVILYVILSAFVPTSMVSILLYYFTVHNYIVLIVYVQYHLSASYYISLPYIILYCIDCIGANINHQRQSDGLTALMVAAMQKNNRMASRLVSKGADVFLIDKSGRTAMDHVKKGHNQVSYSSLFLLFIRCLIKSKRCFNNRC